MNYLNTLVAGHLPTNSLVFGKISLFLRLKVNTIILQIAAYNNVRILRFLSQWRHLWCHWFVIYKITDGMIVSFWKFRNSGVWSFTRSYYFGPTCQIEVDWSKKIQFFRSKSSTLAHSGGHIVDMFGKYFSI